MNIKLVIKYLKSLNKEQLDEILDKRDKKEFDSAWCEANETIQSDETSPCEEQMFSELSEASNNHEVSSYIIDDINLIYRTDRENIKNEFINYLKECYEQGKIPN